MTNLADGRGLMLALASPGPVRRNMATNPGCEAVITGWYTNNGSLYPLTRSTISPISGVASVYSQRTATTPNNFALSAAITGVGVIGTLKATPGKTYTLSLDVRPQMANRRATVSITFRNASNVNTGANLGSTTFILTAGQVDRVGATATAPANTENMYATVQISSVDGSNVDTGERVHLDNFLAEEATEMLQHFDGDTPIPSCVVAWEGTSNDSTSVATKDAAIVDAAYLGTTRLARLRRNGCRTPKLSAASYNAVPYVSVTNGAAISTGSVAHVADGITHPTARITYASGTRMGLRKEGFAIPENVTTTVALDVYMPDTYTWGTNTGVFIMRDNPNNDSAAATLLSSSGAFTPGQWSRVWARFTVKPGRTVTTFYYTHSTGTFTVGQWWEMSRVIEDTEAGPYFDGDYPKANWLGAPAGSVSTLWAAG